MPTSAGWKVPDHGRPATHLHTLEKEPFLVPLPEPAPTAGGCSPTATCSPHSPRSFNGSLNAGSQPVPNPSAVVAIVTLSHALDEHRPSQRYNPAANVGSCHTRPPGSTPRRHDPLRPSWWPLSPASQTGNPRCREPLAGVHTGHEWVRDAFMKRCILHGGAEWALTARFEPDSICRCARGN